jgi:hypothetical protein
VRLILTTLACIAAALSGFGPADHAVAARPAEPLPSIVSPKGASDLETLAAHEVRRYVYLRTGRLLPIVPTVPDAVGAIVVARKDRDVVTALAREAKLEAAVGALSDQAYLLKTIPHAIGPVVLIAGGDDAGTLYGAYRFAEQLGVRFDLHGDVVPDKRIDLNWPVVDESAKPLFALRGIQPFHDFPEGPDWWNADDYKAVISQLPKMGMNFIGLHTYPEGGPNAEPTVWIGLPGDVAEDGTVKFSYPASTYNTLRPTWGYAPKKTGEYLFGAAALFDRDDYGADVMRGLCPEPATTEHANEVFNRTAAMLREAFEHAHALGVKTCVGTETPLTVPRQLQQRLRDAGKDPADLAVVQELYEGIFARAARAYPIDYYWMWTPEWWLGQVPKDHVEKTVADMLAACKAAQRVHAPFQLATCGWVLGPPDDRSLWDEALPKDMPVSCINRDVGKAPVDPSFLHVTGREKWAIPWLEDDPALTSPQLWVGRMRRDAADALRYGCTGLMGIHWRTRILSPNVSALAKAAWSQSGWNTNEVVSAAINGGPAGPWNRPISNTDDDVLYQTVRWAVSMYRLFVPNGTYTVTLKFCESNFGEAGRRVFDVKLQGKTVIEKLDVVARVGVDAALDCVFKDIAVTNGYLEVEFVGRSDAPSIAAIAVEGPAATLKINCGGPAYKDYAADTVLAVHYCPTEDFYLDWATAQFGPEAAQDTAHIFEKIDGHLPQPVGWVGGPGGTGPDGHAWADAQAEYAFVDELAALRSRVVGAGSLERFDYWLNTFRYMRALARMRCVWGELSRALEQVKAAPDAEAKKCLAHDVALPARRELIGAIGEMYQYLLATVSSSGEMGTIANWEQHMLPGLLGGTAQELTQALGAELPQDAMPPKEYAGLPRLIVPTVRTSLAAGETLTLKVIYLSASPPKEAALFWREMGRGEFAQVPLSHVARAVYSVQFPPEGSRPDDVEYYVRVLTADDKELFFPATAPSMNQTLVVMPHHH